MYFIRKLKPPRINIEAIFGLSMIPILLMLFVFSGFQAMFGFIAIIELIAVFIQFLLYFKSKNINFLWMALALFIVFIFAVDLAWFGLNKMKAEFPLLAVGVIIAAVVILYLVFNKKIKWRTREILELAAIPVSEFQNGFTERPQPLGKIKAAKWETEAFTSFVKKNLIAIPYVEKDVIYYSLTTNYWKQLGLNNRYNDDSWVSLDEDGNVNVFISKRDYLNYKDKFSFDQLCKSLGEVFIAFFDMFKQGEGKQIINKLNDLQLNPLIE